MSNYKHEILVILHNNDFTCNDTSTDWSRCQLTGLMADCVTLEAVNRNEGEEIFLTINQKDAADIINGDFDPSK